jgi:hypothetical protein
MNEKEWVSLIIERLRPHLIDDVSGLKVSQGHRPPYAKEITQYREDLALSHHTMSYQTDILVSEELEDDGWIPRIIIEAKNREGNHP